jgi:hypothetical protein
MFFALNIIPILLHKGVNTAVKRFVFEPHNHLLSVVYTTAKIVVSWGLLNKKIFFMFFKNPLA